MNFIELIPYLKDAGNAEQLARIFLPNIEYDAVDIYFRDRLSTDSEVVFFDAEDIPGTINFERDGKQYVNLLPLTMTQEMVEEYVKRYGDQITDADIARRIIDYAINDA